MSIPELSQIGIKRKILGLTQKELAKEADVSQSLIAKIESAKLKPNYILAKQIFETLNRLESENPNNNEKTLKEIMTTNIISCSATQTVKDASKKLIEYNISQVPVFDGERVIGTITERIIIETQSNYGKNASTLPVTKVAEPPLPLLDASTPATTLYSFMRYYPAVLVTERGQVIGIIARADLMRR